MKITEILKDSEYKLELFSQKAIENLEEKLSLKKAKPHQIIMLLA